MGDLERIDAQVEVRVRVMVTEAEARHNEREKHRQALQSELTARASKLKPMKLVCGARNRQGQPCQCKKLLRGGRCKFHGGMSTGPRTPEGRARSADAARRGVETRRMARAGLESKAADATSGGE